MSLNADLPDNPDDSIVEPPNKKGSGVSLTAVADPNPDKKKELSPELTEALINNDTKIQAVIDHVKTTTTLTQVQSELLGQGTVDRYAVESAAKVFPGLIGQQFQIEEFSLMPSKTNHRETVRYMGQQIALEHIKVNETFAAFAESLAVMQSVLNELDNRYLGLLMTKLEGLREYTLPLVPLFQDPKNVLVMYFGEMVNLLEIDLTHLDISVFQYQGRDEEGFVNTLSNLSELFREGSLNKNVICGALRDKTINECLDRAWMESNERTPINIGDLIESITSHKLRRMVLQFSEEIPNMLSVIGGLYQEADQLHRTGSTFESVNQYILKNTKQLNDLKSKYNKACSFVNKLIEVLVNMEMMFEYIRGDA